MRIMVELDWSRSTLLEIGGKFASGADVEPDKGQVIARWHAPGSKKAWVIVEAADSASLQDWLSNWSDYMDVVTHVIVDDDEVGMILAKRLLA
jgi:hypothetical protein